MLVMKSNKSHLTDRMEQPNQENSRTLGEKKTYKYFGKLEADTIKQVEMKEKNKKKYLRKTRKLQETKPYSRNLIKESNTWAVSLLRYSGPFLKERRKERKRSCRIVDSAISVDRAEKLKGRDKKEKYLNLARELRKLWNVKVMILPIANVALGTVTKGLIKGLGDD